MAAVTSAGASSGVTCPALSISTIREAGIARAMAFISAAVEIASCRPTISSVGQSICGSSGVKFGRSARPPRRGRVTDRIAGKDDLPQMIDHFRLALQRGGGQEAGQHRVGQEPAPFALQPLGRFQSPRGGLGRVGRGLRVAENQPGQPRPMRLERNERPRSLPSTARRARSAR